MRLKFWNRKKKIPEFKAGGIVSEKDIVKATNDYIISKKQASVLDDMPHGTIYKLDGQCFGKLKSGVRCSRVVKEEYCYQHKRR